MLNPLKTTLIVVAMVGMVGCSGVDHQDKPNGNYLVIKIDGCEYIESSTYTQVPLIHKGNCNNPIHKNQFYKIARYDLLDSNITSSNYRNNNN